MTCRDFDLVDFFICDLEDVIMDRMTIHRRHPFAHWICWILAQLGQNAHLDTLAQSRTYFAVYSPTTPRDVRRGPRGQRRAQQVLDERALAEGRVAYDPTAAPWRSEQVRIQGQRQRSDLEINGVHVANKTML